MSRRGITVAMRGTLAARSVPEQRRPHLSDEEEDFPDTRGEYNAEWLVEVSPRGRDVKRSEILNCPTATGMNPPDLHGNPFSNFPLICEKVHSQKISPSFRDLVSSMSQVTCLPVASSVLHFTGVPPAGTPLGTVPAGLLLFIPFPCKSQPRHTTPSERANARARTSRVSSAPFSEQRPRFGSIGRARPLTKTPARRQISDPRFPVGEKKQVAISRVSRTRRRRAA